MMRTVRFVPYYCHLNHRSKTPSVSHPRFEWTKLKNTTSAYQNDNLDEILTCRLKKKIEKFTVTSVVKELSAAWPNAATTMASAVVDVVYLT